MESIAPTHMLGGYKVIDFTQAVAGPTATLMLAEMGAEVIKVELMPNGDLTRAIPLIKNGRSGYFVQHNRGKKSICVDVKNPEGLALIEGLIPHMDVLMENFAPGVIGRLGLDYQTVKGLNPRIMMCSLSASGQTGPLANEPGFDTLGAAYSGITSMGGEADGSPYVPQAAMSAPALTPRWRFAQPCSIAGVQAVASTSTCRCWMPTSITMRSAFRCIV